MAGNLNTQPRSLARTATRFKQLFVSQFVKKADTSGNQGQYAATVPLTVRGAQGQTANLVEYQNYLGTVIFAVNAAGQLVQNATNAITALAGGGQSGAPALASGINRVTTVASAADSVKLPAATAGLSVTVINAAAANSLAVFPFLGDAINAGAANAVFNVAAAKTATFYCAVAGTWNAVLSA